MIKITVTNRDGASQVVESAEGLSLMEAIRDHGFDQLLALCGGCCSCATCHVHIDPSSVDGMEECSADESDLLDSSAHRDTTSRLSCQVILTQRLDGLRVRIAAED